MVVDAEPAEYREPDGPFSRLAASAGPDPPLPRSEERLCSGIVRQGADRPVERQSPAAPEQVSGPLLTVVPLPSAERGHS